MTAENSSNLTWRGIEDTETEQMNARLGIIREVKHIIPVLTANVAESSETLAMRAFYQKK